MHFVKFYLPRLSDGWKRSVHLIRPIAVEKPTPQFQEMYDFAEDVFGRVAGATKAGCSKSHVLKTSAAIPEAGYTVEAPIIHGWDDKAESPHWGIPEREVAREKRIILQFLGSPVILKSEEWREKISQGMVGRKKPLWGKFSSSPWSPFCLSFPFWFPLRLPVKKVFITL